MAQVGEVLTHTRTAGCQKSLCVKLVAVATHWLERSKMLGGAGDLSSTIDRTRENILMRLVQDKV